MNYITALGHLNGAAEHVAQTTGQKDGWRLHVQALSRDSRSHCSVVDLQHWEGDNDSGHWYSVANVSCNVGSDKGCLRLYTSINCTMCGRWSEQSPRARGLQKLFEVADMFEEFTAGKVFEV